MSELTYKRGIADVTRDIRIKTGQFLMDAIEIGRLLFEAKSMVEPGSWGKYVEEELPFSHSWANNYMRLYKELGEEQLSIFGNSQALMNLSPTKALELLVLPEPEREEFMEAHDVESMSSRELHQAIKDLEAEKQARQTAEDSVKKLLAELEDARVDAEGEADKVRVAEGKLQQLEEAVQKRSDEMEDLRKNLQEARRKERNALEKLKQLQENPEIPDVVMEQLRQEAEFKAAEAARKEAEQKFASVEEKLRSAEAATRDAEAKLVEAQKEAKLSNPNVVIFKTIMGQIQDDFNRMNGVLLKAQQDDPAVAENLRSAFLGMLEKLREAI